MVIIAWDILELIPFISLERFSETCLEGKIVKHTRVV